MPPIYHDGLMFAAAVIILVLLFNRLRPRLLRRMRRFYTGGHLNPTGGAYGDLDRATTPREHFYAGLGHARINTADRDAAYIHYNIAINHPDAFGIEGMRPFEENFGFLLDAAADLVHVTPRLHPAASPLAAQVDHMRDALVTARRRAAEIQARPAARGARPPPRPIPAVRRQEPQRAAPPVQPPPRAFAEAYVGLATQHTDDPQNTHDTGVLACMRGTLARLRKDQGDAPLPSIDEIRAYMLNDSVPALEHVDRALAVLDRLGERIIAIGSTDTECLQRVWLRADDPRNAQVKDKMRRAIYDAIVDCWENGSVVCVNGRSSRFLSALVLLDHDEENWAMKKVEQFRNDVFEEVKRIIDEEAKKASVSSDPDEKAAGQSYFAAVKAPESAERRLADKMRGAISAMVDEKTRTVPFLTEQIKKEALAAIV